MGGTTPGQVILGCLKRQAQRGAEGKPVGSLPPLFPSHLPILLDENYFSLHCRSLQSCHKV